EGESEGVGMSQLRAGIVPGTINEPRLMQPGHVSLPNGTGLAHSGGSDGYGGIAPNELTRSEDRDPIAGTPWHKSTPARIEAL
ncbi:MAG: hypothetical protein R3F21_26105, partial [Myxococcota bacterium]